MRFFIYLLILKTIPGFIYLMPKVQMIIPQSVLLLSGAKFNLKNSPLTLTSVEKLWVQEPKVTGKGHYSHRIAFGPDGKMFITSGDRQKLAPAQHFNSHLGKVLRLNDDGTVPNDNPWQNRGEMAKQFWSIGHRNMLGVDFDDEGRLWVHEMGPLHGDELNLIIAGKNYGWPIVSNGDHYSVSRSPIIIPVLISKPLGSFGCPPLHRPALLFMMVRCLQIERQCDYRRTCVKSADSC